MSNKKYTPRTEDERKKHNQNERERRYRLFYGITLEERDARFAEQRSTCALCGWERQQLCVDMTPDKKVFRGLLCRTCKKRVNDLEKDPRKVKAIANIDNDEAARIGLYILTDGQHARLKRKVKK